MKGMGIQDMTIRRILALALAVALALSFTACGDGGSSATATDPNAGIYTATTAEMLGFEVGVTSVFAKGFTIELMDNGKCRLEVDGKKANGTWSLDGQTFHIKGGGVDCSGTLEGSVIALQDVMSSGLNMTFLKEGASMPAATTDGRPESAADAVAPDAQDELPADNTGFWAGDWYGWWNAYDVVGDDWASILNVPYDAYARITFDDDGMGRILFYEDIGKVAEVDISISADGARSESGLLYDAAVGAGDWIIDPDESGYDNMLFFKGRYIDPELTDGQGFYYAICLRPWGETWDGIPDDLLPPYYYDWYLDYIADGSVPMPDAAECYDEKIGDAKTSGYPDISDRDDAQLYVLTSVDQNGQPMSDEDFAAQGLDAWYVLLYDDGTGVLNTDTSDEITWVYPDNGIYGKIDWQDSQLPFRFEGRAFIIEEETSTFYYLNHAMTPD